MPLNEFLDGMACEFLINFQIDVGYNIIKITNERPSYWYPKFTHGNASLYNADGKLRFGFFFVFDLDKLSCLKIEVASTYTVKEILT